MEPMRVDARLVCSATDLAEGETRRVECASGSMLLLRKYDKLHCYANRCPHRGTELDWAPGVFLDLTRELLICSTHGARFSPTSGYCVFGPCVGESLTRVPIIIESGKLYLPNTL